MCKTSKKTEKNQKIWNAKKRPKRFAPIQIQAEKETQRRNKKKKDVVVKKKGANVWGKTMRGEGGIVQIARGQQEGDRNKGRGGEKSLENK